jgi:hypothetical protein
MGFRGILSALTVAVALSACGGIVDPSKNKMDTITGTIPVGGFDFKPFSTSKNGEIQVTISSLAPTPSAGALMGIALGQAASGGCAVYGNYVTTFIVGRSVQFGLLDKGSYCVQLFDTGSITVPTTYTGILSYP